jgi:excisionase family DNA binding protein
MTQPSRFKRSTGEILPISALAAVTVRKPEDEILTAREAQDFLKIGRTKLWDLTRRNEIPAYRVGPGSRSSLRYMRTELLRWLESNRVNGSRL